MLMRRIVATAAVVGGLLALPASAGAIPPPPECELGQARAALNATQRADVDQAAKHTLKAAQCLLGLPPRSVP